MKKNSPTYYFDLTFSFLESNLQAHSYDNIYAFIERFYRALPYHREALFVVSFLELERSNSKLEKSVLYAAGALARMNQNLFSFNGYSTSDFMSMVEKLLSAKHEYDKAIYRLDFLLSYTAKIYYELSNSDAVQPEDRLRFRANAHRHVLKLSQRSLEKLAPLPLIVETADLNASGGINNIEVAKNFYSIAAIQGNGYSSAMLGAISESEGDYDSAISYYQKAINNGYTKASSALARVNANKPKPHKPKWQVIRDVMLEDSNIRSALEQYDMVSDYCYEFNNYKVRDEWENTFRCKRYDACMSLAESLIDKKDDDKDRMCRAKSEIKESIYAAFSGQSKSDINRAFDDADSSVRGSYPSFKSAFPYIKVDFNKIGQKMERDEQQARNQAAWASLTNKIANFSNAVQADLNAAERAIEQASGVRSAFKQPKAVRNVESTISNIDVNLKSSNVSARVNNLTSLSLTNASSTQRKLSFDEIASDFNAGTNGIRGTGNIGTPNNIPFTFDNSCYLEMEAQRKQCEATRSGFELVSCTNNAPVGPACEKVRNSVKKGKPSTSITK